MSAIQPTSIQHYNQKADQHYQRILYNFCAWSERVHLSVHLHEGISIKFSIEVLHQFNDEAYGPISLPYMKFKLKPITFLRTGSWHRQLYGIKYSSCYTHVFLMSIISSINAKLEILTAVLLKIQIFCDVMLCHWGYSSSRFKGSRCLHLQGQAVNIVTPTMQHNNPEDLNLQCCTVRVSDSNFK
jgi:hypothetical protein